MTFSFGPSGTAIFGNECTLTMHHGRSLDVIVTAQIERALWEQLVEPERFATASLVAEVIAGFCEPDLAMPEVYALLTGMIGAIAASSDPRALVPRFSMRLLTALGLEPPNDRCVRCPAALEDRAWLDPDAGGFICERCRERWRDLIELDHDDLINLRAIAARKGGSVRAAVVARARVAQSVDLLIAHHLGRRPKASTFA